MDNNVILKGLTNPDSIKNAIANQRRFIKEYGVRFVFGGVVDRTKERPSQIDEENE